MESIEFFIEKTKVIERWTYRGEGNAHLALSLVNSRRVLIFKKQNLTDVENWKNEIKFYKCIMGPLFGAFGTNPVEITINGTEIDKLERILRSVRPENRLHKGITENVALFHDLAYLSDELHSVEEETFSIEIKPKNGISSENECYFCQKQQIKLREGKIKRITNYCPRDLFSGNYARMLKAVKSLVENPQNNLQILKNGKLRYGEKFSKNCIYPLLEEIFDADDENILLEEFCMFLLFTLMHKMSSENGHICNNYDSGVNNLPKDCVLDRIARIQSCSRQKEIIHEDFSYVTKFLKDIEDSGCPECLLNQYVKESQEVDNEKKNEASNICHYVAKIAKDCSLMVTFRKYRGKEKVASQHTVSMSKFDFVFDIKIFDLYPKPQINI